MPVDRDTSYIAKVAFRACELRRPATYEDDDEQVLALEDHYAEAVKICLEAGDWSFASRINTITVNTDVDDVDPRLPHAFDIPDGCLVLREVITTGVQWRQDWLMIRADTDADLTIRYTMRIDDETLAPSQFLEAVGLRLALMLARPYLEVQSKIDRIQNDFDLALRRALRTDALTASPVRYNEGSGAIDWAGEATL